MEDRYTSEARGQGRDGSCGRNDETDEGSETYRHDQHRSNASETPAPSNQSCAWKTYSLQCYTTFALFDFPIFSIARR